MNNHETKNFLNQVVLEGIISSEVRIFEMDNSKNAEFYLLSRFSRKDSEEKIKVIFWKADRYLHLLKKDNHLLIIGELQKDKYVNKKGEKVNTFKISANYVQEIFKPLFLELPI